MPKKELLSKEKSLYCPRQRYLDLLKRNRDEHKHTLLLAPKGFGKSMLIRALSAAERKEKQKSDQAFVYLDLARVSISPENFAQEFIGSVACALEHANNNDARAYQDLDFLSQQTYSAEVKEILGSIRNEFQKIKPDQRLILTQAFAFAEQVAKDQKQNVVIALDDAEELLGFNNYPQIRDSAQLFRDTASRSSNVTYVLVSSSVTVMRQQFSLGMEIVTLEALSQEESRELAEKILGKMDQRVAAQLHQWCAGIPIVVVALARKLRASGTNVKDVSSVSTVKDIFAREIATADSPIYRYAKGEFLSALNRARGASLLKSIVQVVALHDHLRLTEIARKIYRSGPVTKSLLDRLGEVDLIKKKDATFEFSNPVVRDWCKVWFGSLELSPDATREEIDQLKKIIS